MAEPTRLQQDLAERIIQLAREDGLAAGAWLNENNLAKRLNVSRTPVRAALSHLEGQGIVLRSAGDESRRTRVDRRNDGVVACAR